MFITFQGLSLPVCKMGLMILYLSKGSEWSEGSTKPQPESGLTLASCLVTCCLFSISERLLSSSYFTWIVSVTH